MATRGRKGASLDALESTSQRTAHLYLYDPAGQKVAEKSTGNVQCGVKSLKRSDYGQVVPFPLLEAPLKLHNIKTPLGEVLRSGCRKTAGRRVGIDYV